jgi:hypothetical protein
VTSCSFHPELYCELTQKKDTKIKLRVPLCALWLTAVIWAGRRVSCHPTVSHGFLKAVQIAVVPALPRAVAAPIDARPATAAELADAPQALAAEYTYYVPSAVAEQA